MAQVEQHVRGLALGEVITVQAGSRGGGKFGVHAAVLEAHAVVTGRCGFVGMVVARAVAGVRIVERAGHQFDLAGGGHQQEIQHVADAGAGQMRVREAHDRAVGLVIAGARIPHRVIGVRAQLHHAEWQCGAWEGVTMAAGADEDIHMLGEIGTGARIGRECVIAGARTGKAGQANAAEQCCGDSALEKTASCCHVCGLGICGQMPGHPHPPCGHLLPAGEGNIKRCAVIGLGR